MKGTPTTKEQITQIMHLYGKGMSGRKIAAEVGLSHAAVHKTISSNSLHITSRSSVVKKVNKSVSKSAKPVIKVSTKHTFTPFTPPQDAPICNATASGIYLGTELSYRQPARA